MVKRGGQPSELNEMFFSNTVSPMFRLHCIWLKSAQWLLFYVFSCILAVLSWDSNIATIKKMAPCLVPKFSFDPPFSMDGPLEAWYNVQIPYCIGPMRFWDTSMLGGRAQQRKPMPPTPQLSVSNLVDGNICAPNPVGFACEKPGFPPFLPATTS